MKSGLQDESAAGNPRLLVRATNWIGDAVMTTPALDALRSLYPNGWIAVLARPWVEPVLSYHRAVDEVFSCGPVRSHGPFGTRLSLAGSLRRRHFDLAILFPNSFDAALLFWLARIPRRLGYSTDVRRSLLTMSVPVPKDRGARHEVYYYLGLVEALSGREGRASPLLADAQVGASDSPSPRLSLRVPPDGEVRSERLLADLGLGPDAPLIGFNPGAAYGPAKCWPSGRFAALGEALVRRYACHILVFGTEREADEARAICEGLGSYGHNLAGRTSLAEAMALIRRLSLLVTNDSGLMHVGAGLDVPLVAIFGSTNPVTTGPWSSRSLVVRHTLPCSPCLRRSCPTDFRCMESIGVDEILEACSRQLEAAR